MFFFKTSVILCLTIYFSFGQILPAHSYTQIPEYLCEMGIKYYDEGNYDQALREFKKVLLINPGNKKALEYIELLTQGQSSTARSEQPSEQQIENSPLVSEPLAQVLPEPSRSFSRQSAIDQALGSLETKVEPAAPVLIDFSKVVNFPPSPKTSIPKILFLGERLKDIRMPVEIEKDKTIIISGENISRFLDTVPNIVKIHRLNENDIVLTGYTYGYTYVHFWDAKGRWTLEFLCIPPKPEGLTLDQELRQSEESASSFKFKYALDWSALETGDHLNDLKRTTYSWNHWLSLTGQSPFGDLYSMAQVRQIKETTDLTYFTLGLENGKLGPFNDFTFQAFDFSPNISNLIFSSPGLRGVMLESPAFDNKLDYTVFWGREGGGTYGPLSPGLNDLQDSFLEGLNLNFTPVEKQFWSISAFHGSGSDRLDYLNSYGYDLKFVQDFDRWSAGYEVGYDSQELAHLFRIDYSQPDLKLSTELRDTNKDFHTMTSTGWRAGEIGALTSMSYKPTDKLEINSRLDIFQDRLYPNPKNSDWLNEDFSIDSNFVLDPMTSIRSDFSLQNELGRISPIRYYNSGIGLYQTFNWIRMINTYVTYRHQDSTNFTSHSNDFINDKVILGMRANIISYLYFYANREMNWLDARFYGVHSTPNSFETGLDWNSQILDSPFYGNFALTYRTEHDTDSPLSFYSGEDYWEAYAEIAYRPQPGFETYCSGRVRKIWGDSPNVMKRIDANIYAGMRYTWDTGAHWNPVGTIKGIAFKDYNFDGLKGNDEPVVEGIKVFLGKDKSQVTDSLGEYKFSRVRAKKAFISLDPTSIPAGFVLTTPASQEVVISQAGVVEVNFGLASRTEISGIVFEDTNNNGKFDENDKGLKNVEIFLEDGTKVQTNDAGRYTFNKAKVGVHTLKLDLNSLPSNYMPTIPILKEIDLSEGSTYIHNIPLQKIPD